MTRDEFYAELRKRFGEMQDPFGGPTLERVAEILYAEESAKWEAELDAAKATIIQLTAGLSLLADGIEDINAQQSSFPAMLRELVARTVAK